ncbi:MAG: metal ABC transporter substrate-binding protein [Longimicrobiales bacterium]|nr:metal ABC transporter substrate-binding protein [Longimicrobiales bacterium]
MRTRPIVLLLAALGSIPAAGCAPESDPRNTGAPVVVATLPPIADLAQAVGGEAVRVRTLLPPGAHPDSYETTPRTAQTLAEAALVIRVGAAADAWLGTVDDVPELVLTEGMRLYGRHGTGEAGNAAAGAGAVVEATPEALDAAHGTGNPHVWLDPIRVRDVLLPRIAEALAEVVPEAAPGIRSRASAYADSLTVLDAEIRATLRDIDGRRFVAAHPAWVYFAERYGLQQVGAVHRSPGTELGSRELARLVEETRTAGVRAVIAEPQLGRAGVDALADELGVPVVIADAVGGAGLEGREDYLSLMRFNARAFARALGGAEGRR